MGVVAEMADRVMVMYAGEKVEEGDVESIFANPRHPYTKGLLKSVPSVDDEEYSLEPIPGTLPSLNEQIDGCRFHPRCPFAQERCKHEQPELLEVMPGRQVACHFPLVDQSIGVKKIE
jgi:oligopeptide/dipeptide ABC transporter ATP-binding protein